MSTNTGRYSAILLVLVGLVSLWFSTPARSISPIQESVTAQATADNGTLSVDDLVVTSVDALDMFAAVAGTSALIAPDGKHFAYLSTGNKTICIYSTAGQKETCTDVSKVRFAENSVRWSPDSRELTFTEDFIEYSIDPDIWVLDTSTGQLTDITDDGVNGTTVFKDMNANIDLSPTWSNDGKSLIFIRYIQTGKQFSAPTLFSIAADGGPPEHMGELAAHSVKFPTYLLAWLPDGTKIAYNVDTYQDNSPENGVWIADLDGQNPEHIFTSHPGQHLRSFTLSPDGRYMLADVTSSVQPTTADQSFIRVAPMAGGGDFLVNEANLVIAAAWAPSGSGLAYIVLDDDNPDKSGLYLTATPGQPGRLVLAGTFIGPRTFGDRFSWSADNTILLSGRAGKPLNVIHLGLKSS